MLHEDRTLVRCCPDGRLTTTAACGLLGIRQPRERRTWGLKPALPVGLFVPDQTLVCRSPVTRIPVLVGWLLACLLSGYSNTGVCWLVGCSPVTRIPVFVGWLVGWLLFGDSNTSVCWLVGCSPVTRIPVFVCWLVGWLLSGDSNTSVYWLLACLLNVSSTCYCISGTDLLR